MNRALYFFLSYAHAMPTTETPHRDADHWVKVFYEDLSRAVRTHADPTSELEIGFFDDQVPTGSDWEKVLTGALGAAEVFVPLYSPGYFNRSWPMRERESFLSRLATESEAQRRRHVLPVLWSPLPSPDGIPDLDEALRIGEGIPEYAVNGVFGLRKLSAYQEQYAALLDRIARRIVAVAQRYPIRPSRAPNVSDFDPPERTETPFVVSVIAPTENNRPPLGPPDTYGPTRREWRPFVHAQALPIAEYAANVAERLGLPTLVTDYAPGRGPFDRCPAVLLVDPWITEVSGGPAELRSAGHLPSWVTPLVVVNNADPRYGERAAELSGRVSSMLKKEGAPRIRRAGDAEEFVRLMPMLVDETRRHYLRNALVFPPKGPSVGRPKLTRSGGANAGEPTKEER